MKRLAAVVGLAVFLLAPAAMARDWFVRAGSDGDGSMSNPFADPWQALDKCESGDVIHVAGGKYYGRLGGGVWEAPVDNLTLLGGYDANFKTRDPWKNLTQLLWDKDSKNRPNQERFTSTKAGTVLDGFTFDQRDQCAYQDDEKTGRKEYPSCDGPMRFVQPSIIRNNIIINPGNDGIVTGAGSTIENNLIVNAVNWGINLNSTSDKQAVATIKNNTIAFTFSFKEPGKGGYAGSGIGLKASANITNNIIAFSDQNGIYMTANAEKTTLEGNVFFMNLWSNLKFYFDGKDMPIDDKDMDELEEVGLKKVAGNEVKNPQLPVDPKWMDAVSKRTSATPGKLEMDDFNKARQLLGLPMIAKGGTPPSGVAPAMDLDDALKLVSPKNAGKAGVQAKPIPVSFQAAVAEAPAKTYKRVDVTAYVKDPEKYEGQALELIVAVGDTANVRSVPSPYKADDFEGTFLHSPVGDHDRLVGVFKKGTSQNRAVHEAMGWWHGSGTPDKVYLAKGTAVVMTGYPKQGFVVDSIERYEADANASANKPVGRDWFVRAGSSGGDGSREKPFKDPWQALEKVEAGDFVHVAEGEYYGKLKTGRWKIDVPYISFLGGYDKDFKERNPWKHPTRLFSPKDYKGRRDGYVIEGEDDHTGAIVDGFVFDRATDNEYKANGDLDYDNSEKLEHLWLSKPGCIIRNNLFVNGAEGAIRIGNGITVENNIFINHHVRTIVVQRGFGNAPVVIRNNTLAFAWEIRFGQGHGYNGHLLSIENGVNAIIDNNIFEFADNDAIRLMANPSDVELTNNTFNHNLFSNIMRPNEGVTVVDDKTFGSLRDFKFKKLANNQVISAGLPVDQKFLDAYLNRTAYVPGKVTMDDWNQLREMIGQPVLATGGQGPEGFMPLYPWDKALKLFPKNPKVTAGARAKDLPVSFTGVARTETAYDYKDVNWGDSAKTDSTWQKLEGQRVAMKVVIRAMDNTYQLSDLQQDDWSPFTVTGPEGIDSGGLPMRFYVKKGTKAERAVRQAKSYSSGTPEQWYVIKGLAKPGRQMVVEVVERAD